MSKYFCTNAFILQYVVSMSLTEAEPVNITNLIILQTKETHI